MSEGTDSTALDDRDVSVLLADHEQASEEARYRDRLLFTVYYFSLVILGGLFPAALALLKQGRFDLLALVAIGGSYAFLLLSVWAYGVKRSRNAAWRHRDSIEERLRESDVPHLTINEAITRADHEFDYGEGKDSEGSQQHASEDVGIELGRATAMSPRLRRMNPGQALRLYLDLVGRFLFSIRGTGPTDLVTGVLIPASVGWFGVFLWALWVEFPAYLAVSLAAVLVASLVVWTTKTGENTPEDDTDDGAVRDE